MGPITMCDNECNIWVGLVWVVSHAHYMAYGMVVVFAIWPITLPFGGEGWTQ